ncbi:hypothetical protein CWE09_02860 [Aliidiomarina minuta]|uniref:Nitrogen fixation protein FixH n=1 Tax=Aliidiomarina minuta TaxID=880057 RepID=A0A432W6J5_9GAMM|nr:FixH family protein [Aliidiomarina minuta]RUO25687.1 hypothetical protein CWE09_02860 [Aliidiomarina minuta]
MQTQDRDTKPWYKHFWPWYIIAMKVAVITACGVTAWLIYKNPASMVVDDYYREGRTINLQLEKVARAEDLGIAFLVEIDDDYIQLRFDGVEPENRSALQVNFYHPTLDDKDFELRVPHSGDGMYRQELPRSISGHWRIIVEPFNNEWRVSQNVQLPQDSAFSLVPDNYGI